AQLRDKFRFAEAATALDQADGQIPDDAPAELRDRLAAARTDLAFARELDDIRFSRIRGGDPIAGAAAMPEKYRAAFRSHGLEPTGGDADALAARVNASEIRHQIVIALDDWAHYSADRAERVRLLALLRKTDPHPFGDRLRDPATRGNPAALDRLAAETDLATVPPDLFVLYMQMRPGAWPQAREQIGAVAARHRDHFWVQTEAAYYYTLKESKPADAAAYLRAALAIRPDNRYALTFLGVQLRNSKDYDAAATVYREVARLDPKDAAGHFNLGVVLRDKRDYPRAAEAFRASIVCDPKNADVHILLAECLQATNDFDGAIASYRAAAELRPKVA
ncbi:MAG: tetratricopeptide repeat protein, partial [Thermoleophilia bacterium]|nr:tetratricopeptide repeat protein [Thermoleophilia bacterium]